MKQLNWMCASLQHSPITIVAAISSQFRDPPHPREVPVPASGKTGVFSGSDVPVSVGLIFDTSGSMQSKLRWLASQLPNS